MPEPDFIMPVHDLDWGPQFNALDGSGVPTLAPPRIKQVLAMHAPKVDADANELGGVPVVLADAPLGTYLGWNVAAGGARPFHDGQICNYVGGMIPFARTRAEREVVGDPRLPLQERYLDHDGYVQALARAVARAVEAGFLLPADALSLRLFNKPPRAARCCMNLHRKRQQRAAHGPPPHSRGLGSTWAST